MISVLKGLLQASRKKLRGAFSFLGGTKYLTDFRHFFWFPHWQAKG